MPVASPQPLSSTGASAGSTESCCVSRVLPRAVSFGIGLLLTGGSASAYALPSSSPAAASSEVSPAAAPGERDTVKHDAPTEQPEKFRIGALAGVGFPRPLSIELVTKIGGYVGLGAEYGLLPQISVEGVYTSTWAASGDLRVFPFRGAFFVGLRGGYQHMNAGMSVDVGGLGSASASADLDTWFVNPRVGLLWTMSYGFSLGIEAGVQVPVSTSFSTTLPAPLALQVRQSTPVQTLSGVLPTVDLLRIGALF